MTVRQAGFQTTVKEDVTLNVAARAAQDFMLKVGEISASVTIESSPTIATTCQQAAGTLPITTVLGGFNNLASVDELQEFRVQASVFAPEFGRTP